MIGLRWQPIISIHAAREGGDILDDGLTLTADISIHAAREGGDTLRIYNRSARCNFNPRRP